MRAGGEYGGVDCAQLDCGVVDGVHAVSQGLQGQGRGGKGARQDKGRAGQAAVEAEGPGGKEGERREPEAADPRADPFKPADCNRASASVIADILEVSQEEGEQAGRMAVRGVRGR